MEELCELFLRSTSAKRNTANSSSKITTTRSVSHRFQDDTLIKRCGVVPHTYSDGHSVASLSLFPQSLARSRGWSCETLGHVTALAW
ncbi:hypothetical protein JTE90_022293 [Oedothorax gibbosus]|uniref:Uncharacterized protein n=1 Tax=Oedothorax gibbosus TaxID=931172 RepID=A0AAV6VX49_9ARAC|nr:hypothetical protein JTE90_022293 [Oedothorax gibbosus]